MDVPSKLLDTELFESPVSSLEELALEGFEPSASVSDSSSDSDFDSVLVPSDEPSDESFSEGSLSSDFSSPFSLLPSELSHLELPLPEPLLSSDLSELPDSSSFKI